MKNNIQFDKSIFYFLVDGIEVQVQWLYLGRGFVGSREYATTYKVHCNYKDGKSFTTSLQCNYTNSKIFLKNSL